MGWSKGVVSKITADTAAECATLCEKSHDCAGWTWRGGQSDHAAYKRCWLLDSSRVGYAPKNWPVFKSGVCSTSGGLMKLGQIFRFVPGRGRGPDMIELFFLKAQKQRNGAFTLGFLQKR